MTRMILWLKRSIARLTGDTITLNGDIDVQRTLVVTKKLTLDSGRTQVV